jgi:hypothetical protein
MDDDDSTSASPSATGIMQCLRMLAEEAGSLRLVRTLLLLREAAEVCHDEALAFKLLGGEDNAHPGHALLH